MDNEPRNLEADEEAKDHHENMELEGRLEEIMDHPLFDVINLLDKIDDNIAAIQAASYRIQDIINNEFNKTQNE